MSLGCLSLQDMFGFAPWIKNHCKGFFLTDFRTSHLAFLIFIRFLSAHFSICLGSSEWQLCSWGYLNLVIVYFFTSKLLIKILNGTGHQKNLSCTPLVASLQVECNPHSLSLTIQSAFCPSICPPIKTVTS